MLRDNKKILAGNFWTVLHWIVSNFLRFLVRKGSVRNCYNRKIRHYLCTYSVKVILRIFCLQHKLWLKGTNGCNGFVLLRIFTEFLPRVFFRHFLEGTESILKWSRKWPWDPCFRRGAKQMVGCSVARVGRQVEPYPAQPWRMCRSRAETGDWRGRNRCGKQALQNKHVQN